MGVFFIDAGRVEVVTQLRQIGPDHWTHKIVEVKWEGAPFAPISEYIIRDLPSWAKVGDDLVELGPYILRRTKDQDYALGGYYWKIVGQGEWLWLYWRMMRYLEGIWWRLLMTLAVWGLAEWPEYGQVPRWADVVRRWKRWL